MRNAKWLFFFLILIYAAHASAHDASGLGLVATHLLDPVHILTQFVVTSSFVLSITFFVAALLRYFQHRVNPLAVPISTIVTLVIMGIILAFLPLAYKLL